MNKQSHEIAAESRKAEADVLGGKVRRAVICGREYTFLQPARRDNRIMFGEVARIQKLSEQPENRVRVLMEMFQFLIDWVPGIAADEAKIEDRMREELAMGIATTSKEVATAWREAALLVSVPFRRQVSQETVESATSSPTYTM